MARCPKCDRSITYVMQDKDKNIFGKERKIVIERPLKQDGKIQWKNVFYIDPLTVMIIVGIILLLLGFRQINDQCYEILEEPCEVIDRYECTGIFTPGGMRDYYNESIYPFEYP